MRFHHLLPLLALNAPTFTLAQSTLNESFETWPPTGWTLQTLGAGLGFIQDWQGESNTGSHSAYAAINNSTCDHWMVTPPMDISETGYELRFWELNSDLDYYVGRSVWASTGSGAPGSSDFVELWSAEELPVAWTEQVVDLSPFAGQTLHLAFRFQGTWHTWFVDDVSVSPGSFVDAGILNWTSPGAYLSNPEPTEPQVLAKNWGTTTIEAATLDWTINGAAQTPWEGTNLNWEPGENLAINLPEWTPSTTGSYEFEAELMVENDFDPANNMAFLSCDISTPKSLVVQALHPMGIQPVVADQAVTLHIKNDGIHPIDTLEVTWAVDGMPMPAWNTETLGLMPGESGEVTIGSVSLMEGVHALTALPHALGDPEWTTLEAVRTVAVNTFHEGFENRPEEGMPLGWSSVFGLVEDGSFDAPMEGEFYYTAAPDDNVFGLVNDTLWMQALEIESGDVLSFHIKKESFLATNNQLLVRDVVTGEVTVLGPVVAPAGSYQPIVLDVSAYAGVKQFGITSEGIEFAGLCRFDLFESTATPHWPSHDLKMGWNEPDARIPAGGPWTYNCAVWNTGLEDIAGTDYKVHLLSEAGDLSWDTLASADGVDLASWERTTVPVTHTWEAVGPARIRFVLESSTDLVPSNDGSRITSVGVVPPATTWIATGNGSAVIPSLNVPFNDMANSLSLGQDDISQVIYPADELQIAGTLHGIYLHHQALIPRESGSVLPVQVAVMPTEIEDMEGGWFATEGFTVVFDGPLDIQYSEDRWIYLPFDVPWDYSGAESLVFRFYQYDGSWPPMVFRSLVHPGDAAAGIRAIGAMDVYALDVDEYVDFGFPTSNYPELRFLIQPADGFAALNGSVVDASNGLPIAGAEVSIEGSSLFTVTDAAGNFGWEELPTGPLSLTVEAAGYSDGDWSAELTLAGGEAIIELEPLPVVAVAGVIVADDAPTVGLPGVALTLEAEGLSFEAVSDGQGQFAFDPAYGATTYALAAELFRLEPGAWAGIAVGDAALQLDTLVLARAMLSPFDPVVLQAEEQEVRWKHPYSGERVRRAVDLGQTSNSFTNEPFENVWLGNQFDLGTDTTTVLAIEVHFDVYELTTDFVTVEVLDPDGNMLTLSEPFLALSDTTLTLPVAQVPLSGTVYAMVHWQDNPESTNALCIDYSDPAIENRAAIRYPAESPQLFSDFTGNEFSMAWHVRMITWDDAEPVAELPTGFTVVRGEDATFPDVSDWTVLTPSPLSTLNFVDAGASNLPESESYRYAIRTEFVTGSSPWTFTDPWTSAPSDVPSVFHPVVVGRVHPNPVASGGTLHLDGWDVESVAVFDAQGRLVMQHALNGVHALPMDGLPTGAYRLVGTNGSGAMQAAFIVR